MSNAKDTLIRKLMEFCDVKNDCEVRAAFGLPIGEKQLLLKLLLESPNVIQPAIIAPVKDNSKATLFIEFNGYKFTFESTYINQEFSLEDLSLKGYRDIDGNFYHSDTLSVLEEGIFRRGKDSSEDLFQCVNNVLKPYYSSASTPPQKQVPIHLFV